MNNYFEQLLIIIYDNSFFIILSGIIFYYFIFKGRFKVFEIQQNVDPENESESRSNRIDTYCSDPKCVRCNLYRSTIEKAKKRLSAIRSFNKTIATKVSQALAPFKGSGDTFSQKPTVFFYRELQSTSFWDSDIFEDSTILESRSDIILSEFQGILRDQHSGWKRNSTPTGSWEVFHLINQGTVIQTNAQLCPKTMEIISELPSVMTRNVFGNVSFSVIRPSTFISEHFGPTNIRLRCHLGLVCEPSYGLCVADQTRSWEVGKTLVFDDSFLHSVSHIGEESDIYRAVLIVDIWHPDLTSEERDIIDTVFAPDD